MTVHPGIGYDIISNHPMFNGAVIGRAASRDFKSFGGSVETLDGGVVLSVGSAIMGPQVFEKALSCATTCGFRRDGPAAGAIAGASVPVPLDQDYRTGAAIPLRATLFGPGQPGAAQIIEQRRVGGYILHPDQAAVQSKFEGTSHNRRLHDMLNAGLFAILR